MRAQPRRDVRARSSQHLRQIGADQIAAVAQEEPGKTLSWTVDRVIPKEVKLEPVTSELSDSELDDMILRLREQLAQRAPLLIEAKATNGSGPAPAE